VPGLPPTVELSRPELVALQRTAQVLIYPLDPVRPSDFFSMAVLEAMAAGTPVIVSDADSMPELWSDAAVVLPRPIDLGAWYEAVDRLLTDRAEWREHSARGRALSARYDWTEVAANYLEVASA
jgi:glycosyltransferase involved in cell wall biosynthesis